MQGTPGTLKRSMLLLVLAVLPLFLIFFSIKTGGETGLLSRAAAAALSPFHRAVTYAVDGVGRAWRGYVWLSGAAIQNMELRKENDELKAAQAHELDVELENKRLRELLGFARANSGHDMRLARVIAGGMSTQADMITIDRGALDGVTKGMAVVTVDGLLGRVHRVFKSQSEVLLLTDKNSAIAATVQSSRARGIVKGRGIAKGAACDLEYIPRTEIVNEADVAVTTGMGDFFPRGIVIGKVTSVDRTSNYLFQKAVVEPVARFLNVEEVLVVHKPAVAGEGR